MKRWSAAFALLCLLSVATWSAVLFEDDFATKDEWVVAYGAFTDTIIGGKYVLENTGDNVGLVTHDVSVSDFTYSLKMDAPSAGFRYQGILFCWQSTFYEGYVFTVAADGQWSLQKMTRSGNTTVTDSIKTDKNSFVSTVSNTLKVSKKGGKMYLYCNGAFLDSVSDNSFSSGSIGFIMTNGETVSLDQATLTDELEVVGARVYFEDDFEDGELEGWMTLQAAGTVTEADGVMKVAGGTNNGKSIVLTSGDYNDGNVRAIVTRTAGADSALYGLVRMGRRADGNFEAFVYQITGVRQRAAYLLTTNTEIKFSLVTTSSVNATATDTLEITGAPDYQFIVNGDTIPDIDWGNAADTIDFNYVGFYMDSSVSVNFDDFVAGDSTAVSIAGDSFRPVPHFPSRPSFLLGGPGTMFDTRGRRMPTGRGYSMDSLGSLGAGIFLLSPNDRSDSPVQRAVVKVR